ncbi:hypothetical protein SDC9_48943 [bioreactor metagenome]|uniref:Uncharacterized protein n=1 Tax=bioreactor metagenome TaxID=1076179 RepID=A0A644WGS0_9ZZZZ
MEHVGVASADADIGHLHQDIGRPDLRYGNVPHFRVAVFPFVFHHCAHSFSLLLMNRGVLRSGSSILFGGFRSGVFRCIGDRLFCIVSPGSPDAGPDQPRDAGQQDEADGPFEQGHYGAAALLQGPPEACVGQGAEDESQDQRSEGVVHLAQHVAEHAEGEHEVDVEKPDAAGVGADHRQGNDDGQKDFPLDLEHRHHRLGE